MQLRPAQLFLHVIREESICVHPLLQHPPRERHHRRPTQCPRSFPKKYRLCWSQNPRLPVCHFLHILRVIWERRQRLRMHQIKGTPDFDEIVIECVERVAVDGQQTQQGTFLCLLHVQTVLMKLPGSIGSQKVRITHFNVLFYGNLQMPFWITRTSEVHNDFVPGQNERRWVKKRSVKFCMDEWRKTYTLITKLLTNLRKQDKQKEETGE